MQKLDALDANFLYLESEKTPNHISSLQIFEFPKKQGADEFLTSLKNYYVKRLHLIPYLTRKLKFIPGNIDHPMWLEDANFDVHNHFSQIELPQPVTFGQLDSRVEKLRTTIKPTMRPWTEWSRKLRR